MALKFQQLMPAVTKSMGEERGKAFVADPSVENAANIVAAVAANIAALPGVKFDASSLLGTASEVKAPSSKAKAPTKSAKDKKSEAKEKKRQQEKQAEKFPEGASVKVAGYYDDGDYVAQVVNPSNRNGKVKLEFVDGSEEMVEIEYLQPSKVKFDRDSDGCLRIVKKGAKRSDSKQAPDAGFKKGDAARVVGWFEKTYTGEVIKTKKVQGVAVAEVEFEDGSVDDVEMAYLKPSRIKFRRYGKNRVLRRVKAA